MRYDAVGPFVFCGNCTWKACKEVANLQWLLGFV